MWPVRLIAALCMLTVAGCATVPPASSALGEQVVADLERRGLGRDALRVIDNLLRHGPPAPRATPALVGELLARPLDALDREAIFRRSVPAALGRVGERTEPRAFDALLATYLEELARAGELLRAASTPFDEALVLRQLAQGLPAPDALLSVADAIDAEGLRRANLAFVEATSRFARALASAHGIRERHIVETRSATIVVGTRGNDVHELSPVRSGRISVLIDPGGDDEYRGSDLALNGFAAIIDLGGNDRYRMDGAGLGAAIAGASLLIDFAGDDVYEAKFFGQGAAAVFGLGALLDLAGDDRYRIEAWGQGLGLGDGMGLVWDHGGNDHYLAGGVPDVFNRAGGVSGAQGVGFGHRGRLAGGIGILRDDAGDDRYEAQMFAQGLGYYYGLGLLWERGGNDQYRALQYAQGNGVHQAVGLLGEDAGDDRYELAVLYGQGMGLDVALGVLVDAAGDDDYRGHDVAQGAATANGFGLFADTSGADRFATGHGMHKWGYAEWLRGLPSPAVFLHAPRARFTPPLPAQRALAAEPMSKTACPSEDPGETLLCRVKEAQDVEAVWRELRPMLETPMAGWLAIALAQRPPGREQTGEIATVLSTHPSCHARALALRAWPTLPAAQSALRSDCMRLQAAGVAAYARLGRPLPAEVVLPSFLRGIAPPDDTY